MSDPLHILAKKHGTPLFVYAHSSLAARAEELLGLHAPFGLTCRYAVKANPHPDIIALFQAAGLHFDASSSYEATALLDLEVEGDRIRLSSQQPAHNLRALLQAGVHYTATSLHQLAQFIAATKAGATVGLRVNPGVGAGHNNRTTTGGTASSFGLWHEYIPQALQMAQKAGITITTLHVHIGSGASSSVWGEAMDTALAEAAQLPDVQTLNIGGGYKIKRAEREQEADLPAIVRIFSEKLEHFAAVSGRKLHLEIEPGTWLVAHSGRLLTQVVDIVDTGQDGYTFLRVDTGMNDFLRPSMYGAIHAIHTLTTTKPQKSYVVVGHNCETGDILTPAPGDPEHIQPRMLPEVNIGDLLIIEDTGAYCASMRAKGYNAYPDAKEVMLY